MYEAVAKLKKPALTNEVDFMILEVDGGTVGLRRDASALDDPLELGPADLHIFMPISRSLVSGAG
jgi:hypothetical protein